MIARRIIFTVVSVVSVVVLVPFFAIGLLVIRWLKAIIKETPPDPITETTKSTEKETPSDAESQSP